MAPNKKILIIDDDLTALDIIDFLFEEKGFEVVRRGDGASAVECAEAEKPDFILVDLMMPGVNGQECIRRLRGKGITIPILAFTAVDDPDIHEEALVAGCNEVVTKPCKPATLIKKVESLLAGIAK